jgi:hypothetical protein
MNDTYPTNYDKPNALCEPERSSEVNFALNNLSDRLYAILDLKNVLRERLNPVLKSYKKDCGGIDKCGNPDAGIPLVNSIEGFATLANAIASDLEDIIERLGI